MALSSLPSETTVHGLVMQTDVQIDIPGGVGSGALPLLQNALGGPAIHSESQGALILQAEQTLAPAPNGNQVQMQSQAGSPDAQIPRPENAPPHRGLAYPATGDTGLEVHGNRQLLNKLFFLMAIQLALAMRTGLFSDAKNPLSVSAGFLIEFATGCNIVCCFSCTFLCGDRAGLPPRILNLTVSASSAFSYISIMGLLLPDKLNLGFTFLGCVACLPALVAAFRGY